MAPVLAVGREGYFYPRSPCGERHKLNINRAAETVIFLSTLSLRRATTFVQIIISGYARISIHALLAESDTVETEIWPVIAISIHALLAESDQLLPQSFLPDLYFYPRSPCGERQDTPSISTPKPDFYPRSPCGERRSGRR